MGHRRLGNILTYAFLGLVMFFVSETHSRRDGKSSQSASSAAVDLTLTLNWGQKFTLSFPQNILEILIGVLCNDEQSTFFFKTDYIHGLYRLYGLFPTTISGDSDDLLSTWRITISYDWWHWYILYKPTRHDSNDSDLKCRRKEVRETLKEDATCSSKPQRVYLGGSRWLVIDDKVEVVTYEYDYDNTDCHYVGCMDDCGTTSIPPKTTTPPTVDSTESVVNITGNNTDIFIGNITNIIMGNETEKTGTAAPQTESSSDQTPVIVGVVIAVLVILILVVILAVMLWRRKKSKNAEANPTFAASNPGAYADAEFIHGGNAQSQATEGGNSQSVPRLPPPYSEVERNPQHGFTNDGYGVSGDVQI